MRARNGREVHDDVAALRAAEDILPVCQRELIAVRHDEPCPRLRLPSEFQQRPGTAPQQQHGQHRRKVAPHGAEHRDKAGAASLKVFGGRGKKCVHGFLLSGSAGDIVIIRIVNLHIVVRVDLCFVGRLLGSARVARLRHGRQVVHGADRIVQARLQGMALTGKALVDAVTDDGVEHGKDRHAKKHPGKAEDTAEDQNGNEHPEVRNAKLFTQNAVFDDVAVDLLQNENENAEIQGVDGLVDHQEQGRGHRTEEGAKEGNDVRHADDRADERRIGHAHEQHAEVGDDADEHGVDDLAHNIAAEDAVRPAGQLQQAIGMLATEDRHGDLLGLRTELFLKDQDIYGRDDAKQDIEDDHHNAVDRARQARDDHAVIELLQPADDHLQRVADGLFQEGLDVTVRENAAEPLADGRIIAFELFGLQQLLDACNQVRHDKSDECIDRKAEHKHGNADPGDLADARGHPIAEVPFGKQPVHDPLRDLHNGIHQIGKQAAVEQSGDDVEEFDDQIIKAAQVGENEPEQSGGDNHKKGRETPFDIFFIAIQLHSVSSCHDILF